MTLLAPSRLWLLLLVLSLGALYVVVQLRRPRETVKFTTLALLDSVAPRRRTDAWRRHLTALLLLATLTALVLSLARPARAERVPTERATVMLAIDVSNSMAATDVTPTRLQAAEEAAVTFVDQLPARVNLGLVSFAGTAEVLVSPTQDRDQVRSALRQLQLANSTAIGEAVYTCLDAIRSLPGEPGQAPAPAEVVLLSDGETTVGRPNAAAGAAAVVAKVPVATIAFGTQDGTIDIDGRTYQVPVNEAALQVLAQQTGGQFRRATSGDALRGAYRDLGSSIGYTTRQREVGRWFTGLGLLLGLVTAGLSLLWGPRLP